MSGDGTRPDGPKSRILLGLNALRRDNPWPEFSYGEHAPFNLPLDGGGRGGREIIVELIHKRKVKLLAEVGCFLGGSALQWLKASDDLTVIGIDPFDKNWAAYLERLVEDPVKSRSVWHLSDDEIARIVHNLRHFGNFAVAMNNVRLFKKRFIPVRRASPEALYYLREREIEPDMIYIDADKRPECLEAALELFPDAILCGDDWLWPDESGRLIMQDHVRAVAERHDLEIEAKRQTWVLHRRGGDGKTPGAEG